MEDNKLYDTVIVGSGPAGLTAAIYNIRAALKTIVVGGNTPGGQLTITTLVENYPGFPDGIGGAKLMTDTLTQVRNLGGQVKDSVVKEIKIIKPEDKFSIFNFQFSKIFEIKTENETLYTKAVIIATGAEAKWLGLPNEKELVGRGISGCATCDGMFFKNKIVAVVGGGDTACQDAVFLTKFADRVYLVHRRDQFRATKINQERVFENKKIEVMWNSEVVEINGKTKLENIKVKNNKNEEEKVLTVDGIFVAIGGRPATEFVKDLIETDENGYILAGKNDDLKTMTSMEGIFAAGDCVAKTYKQAIVAAGEGAKAGLDAEEWLLKNQ